MPVYYPIVSCKVSNDLLLARILCRLFRGICSCYNKNVGKTEITLRNNTEKKLRAGFKMKVVKGFLAAGILVLGLVGGSSHTASAVNSVTITINPRVTSYGRLTTFTLRGLSPRDTGLGAGGCGISIRYFGRNGQHQDKLYPTFNDVNSQGVVRFSWRIPQPSIVRNNTNAQLWVTCGLDELYKYPMIVSLTRPHVAATALRTLSMGGEQNDESTTFYTNGSAFTISWAALLESDPGEFTLYLYPANNPNEYLEMIGSTSQDTKDGRSYLVHDDCSKGCYLKAYSSNMSYSVTAQYTP